MVQREFIRLMMADEKSMGLVYRSTGSWYVVQDRTGVFWNARIKGRLKIDEEISSTNPIAIGDRVALNVEDEDAKTAIITEIAQRDNYIVRVSPHNKNQKHIVPNPLASRKVNCSVWDQLNGRVSSCVSWIARISFYLCIHCFTQWCRFVCRR